VVAIEARCEIFMSQADAARAIFTGVSFEKKSMELSETEAKAIEKASGQTVRSKNLIYYRDPVSGRTVFIDQVLGKHEFITYAVGIDSKGEVGVSRSSSIANRMVIRCVVPNGGNNLSAKIKRRRSSWITISEYQWSDAVELTRHGGRETNVGNV